MTASATSVPFDSSDTNVATGPRGQRAHRAAIAHTDRFERRLWSVAPGVWSLVGNGLSNQNFVLGPDGLIVIDTGESNEEMAAALAEIRTVTDAPVAAVIYTHFHYVSGTRVILDAAGPRAGEIPIWGHEGIVGNLQRVGGEVSAAAGRGLVHQFGMLLPDDGPDGLLNVGLGLTYRSVDHAPFTPGFVAPTHTVSAQETHRIAGLEVRFTPAPSDADDSLTIWFPELDLCVHNIVWPTLFNIFAIRGEEYRDPRVLLGGLDHIAGLRPDHLVGTHGPPISGVDAAAEATEMARDAIQFLWDQTVRGINRGLTTDELVEFVQLPELFSEHYVTTQYYGVVEHHVRQIHAGLRGWFDGNDASLFPTPPAERARKLIEGFGGPDEIRRQAREALAADDVRWAIELASWLVRVDADETGRLDGGTPDDRSLLAAGFRTIAQRTTAANIRNWCLTRALELEGSLDIGRHRTHRFGTGMVSANPPDVFVRALRVLLVPARAEGLDHHLRWEFDDGTSVGLHLRRQVAVPTDGSGADATVRLSLGTWASLLGNRTTLSEAIGSGDVEIDGDHTAVITLLGCFDHQGLCS